jgi:hypothetical protein
MNSWNELPNGEIAIYAKYLDLTSKSVSVSSFHRQGWKVSLVTFHPLEFRKVTSFRMTEHVGSYQKVQDEGRDLTYKEDMMKMHIQ